MIAFPLWGSLDSLYGWVRRVAPRFNRQTYDLRGPQHQRPVPRPCGAGANPIAAANTVTVSGTVGGTRIVAMNDNDNLLFVDFSSGRIRRIVLSGADLTQPDMSSIAYNGGSGGLLSLMLDADGFVYVSNTNAIFKVVLQ